MLHVRCYGCGKFGSKARLSGAPHGRTGCRQRKLARLPFRNLGATAGLPRVGGPQGLTTGGYEKQAFRVWGG